jgi:hypothetical protein
MAYTISTKEPEPLILCYMGSRNKSEVVRAEDDPSKVIRFTTRAEGEKFLELCRPYLTTNFPEKLFAVVEVSDLL